MRLKPVVSDILEEIEKGGNDHSQHGEAAAEEDGPLTLNAIKSQISTIDIYRAPSAKDPGVNLGTDDYLLSPMKATQEE